MLPRIIAYTCLACSGALAALYGYATGDSQFTSTLRAAGWAATAVVGGCCPAWFFAHVRAKAYGQAVFTVAAGLVCASVTLYGSIGGLSASGDKHAAARSRAVASAKDAEGELARLQAAQAALEGTYRPTSAEALAAAQNAVRAAERTRLAECEKRGPSGPICRDREKTEAAANAELVIVAGNKAATDKAMQLKAEADAVRQRLKGGQLVQSINPGAQAVSRLLRVPIDDAAALSALLGALALELAAMAAMLRADAHARPTLVAEAREAPAAHLAPVAEITALPARRALSSDAALIARFMLECLPRAEGEQVMRGAVYKRFLRWCSDQSPPATPPNAPDFWQHFEPLCDRVGIQLRTKAGKVFAIGVRLAA